MIGLVGVFSLFLNDCFDIYNYDYPLIIKKENKIIVKKIKEKIIKNCVNVSKEIRPKPVSRVAL